MAFMYATFLVGVGVILWLAGVPLAQSIYLAAAAGIVVALLSAFSSTFRIFARWWHLSPLSGLLLAALAYDHGYSWMLAAAFFVFSLGIYGYFLMQSNDVRGSSP